MRCDVLDPQSDDITPTQLAVQCDVEQRQVPLPPSQLQVRPDGPNVLRLKRGFAPVSLPLFQGTFRMPDDGSIVTFCMAFLLCRKTRSMRRADRQRIIGLWKGSGRNLDQIPQSIIAR